MKLPIATLGLLIAASPLAQANAATCTPTAATVRWQEATIGALGDSSQALLQLRATGPYLTADLICSLNKCVGFIGGLEAVGTLKRDANYNLVGVRFQSKSQGRIIPSAEFTCR